MEKSLKKLKFWDVNLKTIIISFLLLIISLFIFSSEQLETNLINYSWLIILFIFVMSELTFIFGMAYHSYKQKKYFWLISILFLGTIFPIIFYIYHVRPQFKKGKGIYN